MPTVSKKCKSTSRNLAEIARVTGWNSDLFNFYGLLVYIFQWYPYFFFLNSIAIRNTTSSFGEMFRPLRIFYSYSIPNVLKITKYIKSYVDIKEPVRRYKDNYWATRTTGKKKDVFGEKFVKINFDVKRERERERAVIINFPCDTSNVHSLAYSVRSA